MALAPSPKRQRVDENVTSENICSGVNLRMNRRIGLSRYSLTTTFSKSVEPPFVHQAFDDERFLIPSMEASDIKVRVAWTEDRLLHFARVTAPKGFDDVAAGALERLKALLPRDFCCDIETFASRAKIEAEESFTPPGEITHRYQRDGVRYRRGACPAGLSRKGAEVGLLVYRDGR